MENKEKAYAFFRRLEAHLNNALPERLSMVRMIREAVGRARTAGLRAPERAASFPEGAFLNCFVVNGVYDFLRSEGLSEKNAQLALLSESYRTHPQYASGSPVRPGRHPFRKVACSGDQVFDEWKTDKGLALNNCPDLALRTPSPFKSVFEAKYHQQAGRAGKTLVESIYQAFFYRGLPRLSRAPRHAEWDYDYSCLLAYDASPDQSLVAAWNQIHCSVKAACWDGANVYVMILTGSSAGGSAASPVSP